MQKHAVHADLEALECCNLNKAAFRHVLEQLERIFQAFVDRFHPGFFQEPKATLQSFSKVVPGL
jgi:hypothetical protein